MLMCNSWIHIHLSHLLFNQGCHMHGSQRELPRNFGTNWPWSVDWNLGKWGKCWLPSNLPWVSICIPPKLGFFIFFTFFPFHASTPPKLKCLLAFHLPKVFNTISYWSVRPVFTVLVQTLPCSVSLRYTHPKLRFFLIFSFSCQHSP